MLESGIQQLVAANAGVQALIGQRFYPVLLPDDVTYPCASYQVISTSPQYYVDSSKAIGQVRIQVDTWSGGTSNATYAAAKTVQAAIRSVLEGFKGLLPDGTFVKSILVDNALDLYEQDARCYRTSTDYLIKL